MKKQDQNMTEEERQEAMLRIGQDKLALYENKQHKAQIQLLHLDEVDWATVPYGVAEKQLLMQQADIHIQYWGAFCYQAIRGLVAHIQEYKMGKAICVVDEQGNVKITVE